MRKTSHNDESAVVYVRVSSKEQEREGFSIPAQKKFLAEYALKNGFRVVRVFSESETAKSTGRAQFAIMLQFLEQNSDVRHLLVEKTDRLYRNLKDYNQLDPSEWPHLHIHLAKESEILSKESKSHQKFIHGIKVLMAKNYSDNLSEEVQKGMNQKASQGLWPSCAPLGYKNNRETHVIEPHPTEGPILTRAFELASSGQYSLVTLKRILANEGLVGRRSRREVTKSQMQRVLSNPIYCGDFVWKKIYYKGKHHPLVTKQLFEDVQVKMGFQKRCKAIKRNFAFTNVLKCAHCGSSITAQQKRKKSGLTYVYYHCASGKSLCKDITYLREEKINDWVVEALSQIQVPEQVVEWTRQALVESHKLEKEYHSKQVTLLDAKYKLTQTKINNAYEDKLEGAIDADFWIAQNDRLQKELVAIETQVASLREANTAYVEKGVELLELAKQAPKLFEAMTPDEKREMVHLVLSNPRIESGSLRYDFKKPFSLFRNVTDLTKWRSGLSTPAVR